MKTKVNEIGLRIFRVFEVKIIGIATIETNIVELLINLPL